jgi:urease beta subunit
MTGATHPGEILYGDGDIEINAGRPVVELDVSNTGDRAIQVGSHFHFFEVNRALVFDREPALGMRLDIPSGTALRFEAGQSYRVALVPFGGARRVIGFNGLVNGESEAVALARAVEARFARPAGER